MILTIKQPNLRTVKEVRVFLDGTTPFEFKPQSREDTYRWIGKTLEQLHYKTLGKADRGTVKAFLEKVSGLSRAQVTRLISQHRKHGRIRDRRGPPANAFPRRYTSQDIGLLAEMDTLHGTLSGPATRKLCERAFVVYKDQRYERLAKISNGHLYNLRKGHAYQQRRRTVNKTRPTRVQIGERRAPTPQGRPGFLRVDTVHQGDQDGVKGVYHINAVDQVTQMQVVVCVERISELYLLPALQSLLEAFPFTILGFHSDNGTEFINKTVARLLEKLRIEQTKSRSRQSNDNALVEGKNGSVIRKNLGHVHISQRFAGPVNEYLLNVLTPYLNYHRPCLFAEERIDAKGKIKKHYPYSLIMTPYDKFRSLPDASQHLRPGVTLQQLDDIVRQVSDNEAVRRVNVARDKLFQSINSSQNQVA